MEAENSGRPPGLLSVLPHRPRTARLLPGAERWRDAVEAVGAELVSGEQAVDVVIAPSTAAAAALATAARSTLLDGPAPAIDKARSRRYLTIPGDAQPTILLPVGRDGAAREVASGWSETPTRLAELRQQVGARAVEAGLVPRGRSLLSVTADDLDPAVLRAVRARNLAPPGPWFLNVRLGPWSKRGILVCFDERRQPRVVVKFGQLPGDASGFAREDHGLALAATAGGVVAAHAPRQLERFDVDGIEVGVQTAGSGTSLSHILRRAGSEAAKRQALDEVAAWTEAVARQTVQPAAALDTERRRALALLHERAGDAGGRDLSGVPAVFCHGDLSDGNVLHSKEQLTVLDWELASTAGFPLWDLLYFAAWTLPVLDGATGQDEHVERLLALFLGQSPSSPQLFRWLRAHVGAVGLDPADVGLITTLCWLHHADQREQLYRERGLPMPSWRPLERFAERWATTPGLGPSWSAWR